MTRSQNRKKAAYAQKARPGFGMSVPVTLLQMLGCAPEAFTALQMPTPFIAQLYAGDADADSQWGHLQADLAYLRHRLVGVNLDGIVGGMNGHGMALSRATFNTCLGESRRAMTKERRVRAHVKWYLALAANPNLDGWVRDMCNVNFVEPLRHVDLNSAAGISKMLTVGKVSHHACDDAAAAARPASPRDATARRAHVVTARRAHVATCARPLPPPPTRLPPTHPDHPFLLMHIGLATGLRQPTSSSRTRGARRVAARRGRATVLRAEARPAAARRAAARRAAARWAAAWRAAAWPHRQSAAAGVGSPPI